MPTLRVLDEAAARAGLAFCGVARLEPGERIGALADARCVALLGMVGSAQWPGFVKSAEAHDGGADPLDRWSQRIVGALADELGAQALYPFGGPPHWPFQRWAQRAEPMHVSPLGLLIHPTYGLWRGYRGALAFAEPSEIAPRDEAASPCETCATRPCLSACPVNAFTAAGYDVAACATHLHREAGRPCLEGSCLARRACPVGAEYAHTPAEASFHTRAFLKARDEADHG